MLTLTTALSSRIADVASFTDTSRGVIIYSANSVQPTNTRTRILAFLPNTCSVGGTIRIEETLWSAFRTFRRRCRRSRRSFSRYRLYNYRNSITTLISVSSKSLNARADGIVIDHSAGRIGTTCSRARIATLLVHTSHKRLAFRVCSTFRTTTLSAVSHPEETRSASTNSITNQPSGTIGVGATRRGDTWISNPWLTASFVVHHKTSFATTFFSVDDHKAVGIGSASSRSTKINSNRCRFGTTALRTVGHSNETRSARTNSITNEASGTIGIRTTRRGSARISNHWFTSYFVVHYETCSATTFFLIGDHDAVRIRSTTSRIAKFNNYRRFGQAATSNSVWHLDVSRKTGTFSKAIDDSALCVRSAWIRLAFSHRSSTWFSRRIPFKIRQAETWTISVHFPTACVRSATIWNAYISIGYYAIKLKSYQINLQLTVTFNGTPFKTLTAFLERIARSSLRTETDGTSILGFTKGSLSTRAWIADIYYDWSCECICNI